ncbi:lipoprotein LpqH [Mycobacterium rhizamassiliense]|uniref:lipoprotein LpqH n=1 Tax=Mycobacterium rhizamassiliense TaxID=1841860 RepID=UPI00097DFFBF|nr:lipoprotein LpqH [Mycobacterium rhizamassiliense]
MRNRTVVAIAALTVALLAACTSRPVPQISSTAAVTVDGKDANFHVVKCGQMQWTRTIDIGGSFAGANIIIDEGAQPASTESVRIQNLGGFTGMYARGNGGNADTSMTGDKFTITGTANGFKTDQPNEAASANFKITVTC